MNTQKNNTNNIIKIVIGGLALVLAIPFCMGVYSGYQSHSGTTGAVAKTLKKNCDCKSIQIDHAAYGLQFNRKEGVTGDQVTFTLDNCNHSTTVEKEAERLNQLLLNEIEGYEKLDVVELNFTNGDTNETAVIRNGKLQS